MYTRNQTINKIKTYVVNGFLDAGKSTYIEKNIARDFFHKRGSTLIFVMEQGEMEYDTAMLSERRTEVVYLTGGDDITARCLLAIEKYQPDRIYIESNIMNPEVMEALPDIFDVVFTVTLIDGSTLELFYNNLRQHIQKILENTNMVIFNRCTKEELQKYDTGMRLMNRNCDYLWQSPLGYSEKAFDIYLPFNRDSDRIEITEESFVPWYLDASEHPHYYYEKELKFTCQIEARDNLPSGMYFAGRLVMTCCLADLQFLGFSVDISKLPDPGTPYGNRCWVEINAIGKKFQNKYGGEYLGLQATEISSAASGKNILRETLI